MNFKPSIEVIQLYHGLPPDQDPRFCEPGDTLLFEDDGVAFTLLEELMRDNAHITWRTLITAHPNEERLGTEEWVGIALSGPLPRDRIIVRGH